MNLCLVSEYEDSTNSSMEDKPPGVDALVRLVGIEVADDDEMRVVVVAVMEVVVVVVHCRQTALMVMNCMVA